MSTLYEISIRCVACEASWPVQVADSLNVGRMPAARAWVIERTLHAAVCPACGVRQVVAKPVLYTDFEHGLWVHCVPEDERLSYPDHEAVARETFAYAFDTDRFPRAVGALRQMVSLRVVFGYEELREKVVCAGHGLDDALVEALKLELLYANPDLILGGVEILVLEECAAEGELRFGLYRFPEDRAERIGQLGVARRAYDMLAARPNQVARSHPSLFSEPYCNILRYRHAPPDQLPVETV
jgi:hypothetical protein